MLGTAMDNYGCHGTERGGSAVGRRGTSDVLDLFTVLTVLRTALPSQRACLVDAGKQDASEASTGRQAIIHGGLDQFGHSIQHRAIPHSPGDAEGNPLLQEPSS
jgi:hypothetical protein